jgi:2-(1,2-epoxy-1,2-dihydrophenyl)acetyl-CoA isomerase
MIEFGAKAIQAASGPADTADAWRWIRRQFGGVVRTITSTDKIFIAAVNGAAAGVGLAFAWPAT